MSPLGIKRTIAVLLVLSPWIFVPGIIKDCVFILAGLFLYISTLDLRKKVAPNPIQQENESTPVARESSPVA
jgi:hypothetical protein